MVHTNIYEIQTIDSNKKGFCDILSIIIYRNKMVIPLTKFPSTLLNEFSLMNPS